MIPTHELWCQCFRLEKICEIVHPGACFIFPVTREKYESLQLGDGTNSAQHTLAVPCDSCGNIVYVVILSDPDAQSLVRDSASHSISPAELQFRKVKSGICFRHLVMPNGKTVHVRTTLNKDGKLIAQPQLGEVSDYVALLHLEMPHCTYKGIIESEELFKPSRQFDLGYGPVYVADQSELRDLDLSTSGIDQDDQRK